MRWAKSAAVIGALGMLSFAAPANAIGVAHFFTTSPMTWTQDAAESGGVLFGSGQGQFLFAKDAFGSPLGGVAAPVNFTLTGTAASSPATCCQAGSLIQGGLLVDFAFQYAGAGPLVIGSVVINPGDNLLSGTGVSGAFVRTTSGSFVLPLAPSNPFLSDFGDLSGQLNFAVGVNFSPPSPVLTAQPGESVQGFTGTPSALVFFASVPETATWAMMIVGFWSVGAVLRRRGHRAVAA